MKFVCDTAVLSTACQNVQRAVSAKTTIPAVEGILIKAADGKLMLTGYDLEFGINTAIEARIEEAGGIVLNAKLLCDILRKLPGDTVRIECDERLLARITSGDADYSLVGISKDDYPELPSVMGGQPIEINMGILKEMVRQTIFSVATNESKAVHTGIKFEIEGKELKLIAVDGFRLAIRREIIEYDGEDVSFIVPAKALSEAVKLISDEEAAMKIGLGKKHMVFEVDDYVVVTRLLEGDFLNYKAAIPSSSATTVRINTKDFISSIERASLIITDKLKSPVRCKFDNNTVSVSSTTVVGTASDRVAAAIAGDSVEIGFNNRYLIEALNASDTDEVIVKLNGAVSPILILPVEGESFLFLVLPVRLKAE
mgnify:CR=1 FL=1